MSETTAPSPIPPTEDDLNRMEAYLFFSKIREHNYSRDAKAYVEIEKIRSAFERAYLAMAETHFGPNKAPAYRGDK